MKWIISYAHVVKETGKEPKDSQQHSLNIRSDIPPRRATIGTDLLRLVQHLVEILLLQTLDTDLHVDANPHIQRLHIADQVYRRLDDRVFLVLRHLQAQTRGGGVHRRLETRAVAGREELFGVGFASVAGSAESFSHGQVDREIVAGDVAGACADDFGVRRV